MSIRRMSYKRRDARARKRTLALMLVVPSLTAGVIALVGTEYPTAAADPLCLGGSSCIGGPAFTLSVHVTGPGTVVSQSPFGGIVCPPKCVESYAPGTVVTLTGLSTIDSALSWSGQCTGPYACAIVMDGNKSAGAAFYYVRIA